MFLQFQKMKITTKHLALLCLVCFLSSVLQAQEVVTTTGGYGSSASAKVTWTIGEPVTETVAGTNSILTQGFNQGDLIITIIKDPELSGLSIKAYPNPATDILKISVGDSELDYLDYILFDIRGQIIQKNKLKGAQSEIPMGNLAPSTYFLKIYKNNTEIAIFKIIKNK